ncbi:TetR/AcrR family transcriptional regulator [Escherichia coli]|nr:TetR/AcrR family transcriptional regulator [Escherichia coli]
MASERKKAIVIGAYSAFIELGFAQTSTTEIARRAKVSKRTIYEVFSNKKKFSLKLLRNIKHCFSIFRDRKMKSSLLMKHCFAYSD